MPPFTIGSEGICKLLKALQPNKAAGPDKISPMILRESRGPRPHTIPQIQTTWDYFKYSFFPLTVVQWNALPPDIPAALSLDGFKAAVCSVEQESKQLPCFKWDMEFNSSKGQVLQITRARKPIPTSYYLHNQKLEITDCARYLDVDISRNLSFNNLIDRICNSANKTLGFLRRNLKTNDKQLKSIAFQATVRPVLQSQIASGSWANVGPSAAIFVGPTLVARCKTIGTLLIQKNVGPTCCTNVGPTCCTNVGPTCCINVAPTCWANVGSLLASGSC